VPERARTEHNPLGRKEYLLRVRMLRNGEGRSPQTGAAKGRMP
jgi:hypothetical protein